MSQTVVFPTGEYRRTRSTDMYSRHFLVGNLHSIVIYDFLRRVSRTSIYFFVYCAIHASKENPSFWTGPRCITARHNSLRGLYLGHFYRHVEQLIGRPKREGNSLFATHEWTIRPGPWSSDDFNFSELVAAMRWGTFGKWWS